MEYFVIQFVAFLVGLAIFDLASLLN